MPAEQSGSVSSVRKAGRAGYTGPPHILLTCLSYTGGTLASLWAMWGPNGGIALQQVALALILGVAGGGSVTGSQVSECQQADTKSS